MRFRTTVTFEYEADDARLEEVYGTTDPDDCAGIDCANFYHDTDFLSDILYDYDYNVKVEVI